MSKDYRKKHMRFSRFEDFVTELIIKCDDPETTMMIKKEFAKEVERVTNSMKKNA